MTDPNTARLDAFSDQVANARPSLPDLEPLERAIVSHFGELAPDSIDQRSAGAALLILGNLLGSASHLPLAQVLDGMKLAGQRLYSGGDVRLAQPCPIPRASGSQCTFTARGVRQEVVDAIMRGHVDVYHPGKTWPPEPEAPTPQTVREGRHSIDDLRRHYRLPEIEIPDGLFPAQIDKVLRASFAEAQRAGMLEGGDAEEVVHLPELDDNGNGNPTDYALCDDGERDIVAGKLSYAGPGFGKSDPTCPACLEIDERGAYTDSGDA